MFLDQDLTKSLRQTVAFNILEAGDYERGVECLLQSSNLSLQFVCRANFANLRTEEFVLDNLTKYPPGIYETTVRF